MGNADRFLERYGTSPYHGVYPIEPTIFGEDGSVDLDGQRRCTDFLIDAGVDGIGLLANYSEQFALSDDERSVITKVVLEHVRGRVPVAVTTSHFSTAVCIRRCREAAALGASMVMVTPPYHGVGIRCSEQQLLQYMDQISRAVDVPVILQDAPVSGVELSVDVLANIAVQAAHVRYFKLETQDALAKIAALTGNEQLHGAMDGAWGGDCAVNLVYELDAGATGTMPGAGFADAVVRMLRAYRSGDRSACVELYRAWLPLLHMERRITGLQTSKVLMKAGGIIQCDRTRPPLGDLAPDARSMLLSAARSLDPLVLRWA